MSSCRTEPVEVLRRNAEPAHFLWRSRLYVVRGVLAHWIETGEWRRSPGAGDPGVRSEARGRPGHASGARVDVVERAVRPAHAATRPDPPAGEEREIWRVEASSGRSGTPGVFDLCCASSGAWSLVRPVEESR